jgi:hypothetical protein
VYWFFPAQIFTTLFLTGVFLILAKRARGAGGLAMAMCVLLLGMWALNTGLSHLADVLSTKLLLEGLWFASCALIPSLFLLSTIQTASRKSAVPYLWLILLVWHIFIGVLALSNPSHELLWINPQISAYGVLSYDRTLLNFINLFILLIEVSISLIFWLQRSILRRGRESIRAILIGSAIALPMVSYLILNVLDPLKAGPDFLPLSFLPSGVLILIAVYRFEAYSDGSHRSESI